MKNFEKYEHQISKVVNEDNTLTCSIAIVSGIKKQNMCSSDDDCNECSKECLKWMYSEYKEPILTEEEKTIVESMIYVLQKIGCTVKNVTKYDNGYDKAYIGVNYTNEITGAWGRMSTPWFKNDEFKEMEPNNGYTIEELGITCQKQKDN